MSCVIGLRELAHIDIVDSLRTRIDYEFFLAFMSDKLRAEMLRVPIDKHVELR